MYIYLLYFILKLDVLFIVFILYLFSIFFLFAQVQKKHLSKL